MGCKVQRYWHGKKGEAGNWYEGVITDWRARDRQYW